MSIEAERQRVQEVEELQTIGVRERDVTRALLEQFDDHVGRAHLFEMLAEPRIVSLLKAVIVDIHEQIAHLLGDRHVSMCEQGLSESVEFRDDGLRGTVGLQ